jgi:hypothetical protein
MTAGATLELMETIKPTGKKIDFPTESKGRMEMVEKWELTLPGEKAIQFCVHVSGKKWTRQDTRNALCSEISKARKIPITEIEHHIRYVITRQDGVDISNKCRRFF